MTLNLALLAAALTVGYAALRDHIRNADDARHAAWQASELLKPTPPIEDSEAKIHVARQGYFQPTLRYPQALITAVKQARLDGRDILADFAALETAWTEQAGKNPLVLTFVHPPLTEPYTGERLINPVHSPERVTDANFKEMLPLLREIRTLILDKNDSGCGLLPRSGFSAKPDPAILDGTVRTSAPAGQ